MSSAQQLAELRGLERGTQWKPLELYCLINISMEKRVERARCKKKKTVQGRFVLTCQKLLFLRELTLLARPSAM